MSKEILRNKFLNKRDDLDKNTLDLLNDNVFNNFINSHFYREGNNIMSFISFRTEVDTHRIIKRIINDNKKAFVPITLAETKELKVSRLTDFSHLELGFYNILTPKKDHIDLIDPNDLDIILVPGAIFSKDGYRIGYGGGYYDRFFSNIDNDIIKIGLAYDFQLIDSIPIEDYDMPVDYIITDKRVIKC